MSKDPPTLLLKHHLKAPKLPTFLRDYASVAALCAQARSPYPTSQLRLSERELIDREPRIKEAQFPVLKSIESFSPPRAPWTERRGCGTAPRRFTSLATRPIC